MNIHETIFQAKEYMALGDYENARQILTAVQSNHMALRLLEEIHIAERQKQQKAVQAEQVTPIAPQASSLKGPGGIPANAFLMISGNMLFWSLAISLWFSPMEYFLSSFASLGFGLSFLLGLYYLFVRKHWWMLAYGWTLLSIGLTIGGFVGMMRSMGA